MRITYSGEACDSYSAAIDLIRGYTVRLDMTEGFNQPVDVPFEDPDFYGPNIVVTIEGTALDLASLRPVIDYSWGEGTDRQIGQVAISTVENIYVY